MNWEGEILIDETNDSFIISVSLGVIPYSYYREENHNLLLEVDKAFTNITAISESKEYRFVDMLELGDKTYLLSVNTYTRMSSVLEIDENYQVVKETEIQGIKPFFVMMDWFVDDEYIYLVLLIFIHTIWNL